MQKDIRNYTFSGFEAEILKLKLPKYTAKQVFVWIYQKKVDNFSAMSDLAKATRVTLEDNFIFSDLELLKKEVSRDGTIKILFKLHDGFAIETAMIPDKERLTICLSSQVGCKFACKFCVSGKNGFERDLSVSEMIGQLVAGKEHFEQKITNIVFMGIGEPLDNFDNLLNAITILTDVKALSFPKRKVCVSTSGLVPKIRELAKRDLGIKLSISLHASSDKVRSAIMPVNKKYPIKELIAAAQEFAQGDRNPVTFEYVLLKGVNDSQADALSLAKLLKGYNFKVNLIPCNAGNPEFKALEESSAARFLKTVKENGVVCTLRSSRGFDIAAACGQLRAQHI